MVVWDTEKKKIHGDSHCVKQNNILFTELWTAQKKQSV
jgi:hypothetical protein